MSREIKLTNIAQDTMKVILEDKYISLVGLVSILLLDIEIRYIWLSGKTLMSEECKRDSAALFLNPSQPFQQVSYLLMSWNNGFHNIYIYIKFL